MKENKAVWHMPVCSWAATITTITISTPLHHSTPLRGPGGSFPAPSQAPVAAPQAYSWHHKAVAHTQGPQTGPCLSLLPGEGNQ